MLLFSNLGFGQDSFGTMTSSFISEPFSVRDSRSKPEYFLQEWIHNLVHITLRIPFHCFTDLKEASVRSNQILYNCYVLLLSAQLFLMSLESKFCVRAPGDLFQWDNATQIQLIIIVRDGLVQKGHQYNPIDCNFYSPLYVWNIELTHSTINYYLSFYKCLCKANIFCLNPFVKSILCKFIY